ncbi:MAG: hypothetical protein JG765_883 [Cereibacter sp.]|jgi:flagellar hook-associated protein 3 FlgL|nr:hypothetical protein [Cereibacter sp.]
MATVSLGDLAHSFMLRRQTVALKAQSQRLSTEMVTGLAADRGAKLGGDFATLGSIDASLARLESFKIAGNEAAGFSGALQSVLTLVDDLAGKTAPLLLTAGTAGTAPLIDPAGMTALQQFEAVMAALNTGFAGRSLLAGAETGKAAVVEAETILTAIETASSGATTAAELATAVNDWFDDPAGYAATAYLGGAALAPLSVGPTDEVTLAVTANDPAVRDTLKGLALAALLGRGVFPGESDQRGEVARLAGESLVQSQSTRTGLAAEVGLAEARIEAAAARNAAETTALKIARTELLGVDSYEAATLLETTKTQLETIYALTERISRLTLVDYI